MVYDATADNLKKTKQMKLNIGTPDSPPQLNMAGVTPPPSNYKSSQACGWEEREAKKLWRSQKGGDYLLFTGDYPLSSTQVGNQRGSLGALRWNRLQRNGNYILVVGILWSTVFRVGILWCVFINCVSCWHSLICVLINCVSCEMMAIGSAAKEDLLLVLMKNLLKSLYWKILKLEFTSNSSSSSRIKLMKIIGGACELSVCCVSSLLESLRGCG